MHQPYPPPPPAPPRSPRWSRFTAWTAGASIAAFAVGGGLATWADADSTSAAKPGSCKAALIENLHTAMKDGPDPSPLPAPPECIGVDRVTLERITSEVIAEYWESPEAGKVFEDAMRRALESAAASP